MNATRKRLDEFAESHPKSLSKDGLCSGLVITRTTMEQDFPSHPDTLRTEEGGQVRGLGKGAVQRILADHNITRVLAEEGGRTSRGSLGLMGECVSALNELHARNELDLGEAEQWWVEQVRRHFASEGPKFRFDPGRSLRANIEDILAQCEALQEHAGGANYLGAMLQHLVGAKLDLVLGTGKVQHHGASVADQSTERKGDFEVGGIVVHVTTHPSEALVRKCEENLREGWKPLIVTVREGIETARGLLRNSEHEQRVDVLEVGQFLTANVYERSLFQAAQCKVTLAGLLKRYNEIVRRCEADPALCVDLGEDDVREVGEG